MSLASNVTNLATRVATEVKSIRTLVNGNAADLSALSTTAKTNLVAAVNELNTAIGNVASDLGEYVSANDSNLSGISGEITAINESLTTFASALSDLDAAIQGIDVSGQVLALIDDTTTDTAKVWSSSKVSGEIADAVAGLVDGAPALLDTLNELAAAIGDDANFVTTITTALGGKANDADVVKLTGTQTIAGVKTFSDSPVVPDGSFAIAKVSGLQTALNAKANSSDVGDTTTNYVTAFEAGLV